MDFCYIFVTILYFCNINNKHITTNMLPPTFKLLYCYPFFYIFVTLNLDSLWIKMKNLVQIKVKTISKKDHLLKQKFFIKETITFIIFRWYKKYQYSIIFCSFCSFYQIFNYDYKLNAQYSQQKGRGFYQLSNDKIGRKLVTFS